MTSAYLSKDTLRNDTQVFLKFSDSIFEICLHLINSHCTSYFLPSSMLSSGAETSKKIPPNNTEVSLPAIPITLIFTFPIQLLDKNYLFLFLNFNMSSNISIDSVDSDFFFVKHISNEPSPQRNNSPNVLNSAEISEARTTEMPTISSIASPNPKS